MAPLVERFDDPRLYLVRLHAGSDVKQLLGIILLASVVFLVSRALPANTAVEVACWLFIVLSVAALTLHRIHTVLRARWGRIRIHAATDELVVTETFPWFRPTRRIARESVGGFWVAGTLDDIGEPFPSYSLMLDRDGREQVSLVRELPLIHPAIALAEELAARMGVSADTRGSDI